MTEAHVLIVEDERIVALHLQQQLRKLGYTVSAMVASGAQALAKIADMRPDVILMDIHIEGPLDGIETAARIPPELEIPVIYLTAYSDETTLARARSTKPFGYLVKPFSERELHATIQMVLERWQAEAVQREQERILERLVNERTAALSNAMARLETEMSERLAAEKALRQAQKMEAIGQLTGGIAHDFNNLLTVVLSAFELIQGDTANIARIQRLCQSGISTIERCMRLIRQLLMFSRRQAMHPERIDPNRLLADFEPLIERAVGKEIETAVHLQPDLGRIFVDASEFQTALLNLVMNAREALADRPGQVTLETTSEQIEADEVAAQPPLKPGRYVVIAVHDSGVGIPPEVLARVFDPFFTTKEVGKGSGLGLSQVYGFVQESEGGVAIESTPGVGTTVRLYLPRTDSEASAETHVAAAPSEQPADERRQCILVVEDEAAVLEITVEALKAAGYLILTATNAAEALAILRGDAKVDILFSDIAMPGRMNGVELAEQATVLRPDIKVLLTSGYTNGDPLASAKAGKDRSFLAKPYRPQDLTAALSAIAA